MSKACNGEKTNGSSETASVCERIQSDLRSFLPCKGDFRVEQRLLQPRNAGIARGNINTLQDYSYHQELSKQNSGDSGNSPRMEPHEIKKPLIAKETLDGVNRYPQMEGSLWQPYFRWGLLAGI